MTEGSSRFDSTQLHEYMLCQGCENDISDWEGFVSREVIQEDDSFPALARSVDLNAVAYSESDTDTLTRFFSSVIWRASRAKRSCDSIDLGDRFNEDFRRYLHDEAPFPEEAHIEIEVMKLDGVAESTRLDRLFFHPWRTRENGVFRYEFGLFGLNACLRVGGQLRGVQKHTCFTLTRTARIGRGERHVEKVMQAFGEGERRGKFATWKP